MGSVFTTVTDLIAEEDFLFLDRRTKKITISTNKNINPPPAAAPAIIESDEDAVVDRSYCDLILID